MLSKTLLRSDFVPRKTGRGVAGLFVGPWFMK